MDERLQAQARALDALLALAEENRANGGAERAKRRGRAKPTRDELHERR